MKYTKRMKRALLQSSIVNSVIFSIFLLLILLYILPRFLEVEAKKEEYNILLKEIARIESEGMNFSEIRQSAREYEFVDEYNKTVFQIMKPEFYTTHFINTQEENYDVFLDEQRREIEEYKSSAEYIQRENSLSTILPVFSETSDAGIGNFDFVHHVETLLYSFNLSIEGEIGAGDIQRYQESQSSIGSNNSSENLVSESIYMIPLSLELVGQKRDIFHFMHYFENVGSIYVENDTLSVLNDTVLENTSLARGKENPEFGIYESQLGEIVFLEANEYPDSSTFGTENSLIELINGEQARERYAVDVILNFYVTGLPRYQLNEFAENTFSSYDTLISAITEAVNIYSKKTGDFESGEQLNALTKMQSLSLLMETLGEEITASRLQISQGDDIESLYDDISQIHEKISRAEKIYNESIIILEA